MGLLVAAPIMANAQLLSTDGGLGVYDPTNNVTWTSNANLMASQAASYTGGAAAFVSAMIADSGGVIHDTPNNYDPSGTYTLAANDFDTSTGEMNWWGAQAWVNYLNTTRYGGSNKWTLPTAVDNPSNVGEPDGRPGDPAISSSQMAELFYGELGESSVSPIAITHNASYALFSNIEVTENSVAYWSGNQYSADPLTAWYFDPTNGNQSNTYKGYTNWAMAVSPGEVSAVPLPGAAWLMLTGMGFLGAVVNKKWAA